MATTKYVSEEALEKLVELIKASLDEKVDVEEGKGLSTNDLTDELLQAINASTAVTTEITETLGTVDEIKTILDKVEALDEEGISKQIETEVADALAEAGLSGIEIVIPEDGELPVTGEAGKFYLIPNDNGSGDNSYSEYVWIGDAYELLGTTDVDMTGYMKESDLAEITSNDVIALWK